MKNISKAWPDKQVSKAWPDKQVSKAWPDSQVKEIANKYISEVIKSGIPVNSAYLFGSYAKGNSNRYSDIDICVISPNFGKDYFEESLKLRFLTSSVDSRIEAVPLSPKDLSDKYSTLASEIKKHGVVLQLSDN